MLRTSAQGRRRSALRRPAGAVAERRHWSHPQRPTAHARGSRPPDVVGSSQFHTAADLDAAALSAVLRRLRSRVLRLAVRHGALTPEVAADLARWGHDGGFSLHAAVLIEAADRPGLERLLRYCARPAFASERLSWDGSDQLIGYRLTKPLTTPRALAPRARDPPELHAGFACAFDQSPWWDSTAAASEPSFHFDQTLN